ncbi:MAG TPA: FAD-binding oxidoreductase [Polyangiaceae bacterium]|nr:FAD-binding oxidoreductase [Polyangiaceae bacterium]
MSSTLLDELRARLGPSQVHTQEAQLRAHRRDAWVLSELDDLEQALVPMPSCVVTPRSVEHVAEVVNLCRESSTPLVPAGLRSGVCGGVLAPEGSVVCDLSALNRVRAIDMLDLSGRFDAGVRGSDAEAEANARGLTIGHFPQSIALSSVGGWVATRAAGQFSTGYGNIEDLVLSLEAVLPDGSFLRSSDAPRASTGPDLRHLLLGSEGTLGIITGVELSLSKAPDARVPGAYYVSDMRAGFEAQRAIIQAGWRPVVLRQYDPREVGRLFSTFREGDDCLLLTVHEGPRERVEVERAATERLVRQTGGRPAPAQATEHWLSERNHVPTFKSFLEGGVIVDTIEVAAPFSRIGELYDAAVAALGRVEGIWNGSAHSSHAYRSGLNLYFSFAVQPRQKSELRQAYHACWDAVMTACLNTGGTISHHHGIGRVRREWLGRELGPAGLATLQRLKRALDPTGFMNPGVLLPVSI